MGSRQGDRETRRQGDRVGQQISLVSPTSIRLPVVFPPGVRQCQALGPAAPYPIWGVDSCRRVRRRSRLGRPRHDPWQEFAQGEYVGHARTPHVPEYRLREGDQIAVYYRRTREELSRPYELQVGDRIRVESLTAGGGTGRRPSAAAATPVSSDDDISRELVVQPDGTITLPLLGQVRATRRTVQSLRDELEEAYKKYLPRPVDHRDADHRQHAARRPAEHGRQPGRHARRPAIAGDGDAGRRHPIAGRRQRVRARPDARPRPSRRSTRATTRRSPACK